MNIPENLLYTTEHEWLRVEGEKGRVGISDYAQHHLGDIVFVELPDLELEVTRGDSLGVIESVKAVATFFTPTAGIVVEVNEELEDSPELLNQDSYENWIAVLELNDSSKLDELMNAEAYTAYCQTLED